jgi:hypothetical protein
MKNKLATTVVTLSLFVFGRSIATAQSDSIEAIIQDTIIKVIDKTMRDVKQTIEGATGHDVFAEIF